MKRAVYLVFVSVLVGCGGENSVTMPSTPAVAQVGGLWTGTVTQTSATGTECAALFQSSNGASDRYTVQITQNGSKLTATSRVFDAALKPEASQTSGVSCSYTGTADGSTIALTGTSCTSSGYQVICNGLARDAVRVAFSVTATVSGNTMSGTTGASYNIFPRGTTANSLGIIVLNDSFTLVR